MARRALIIEANDQRAIELGEALAAIGVDVKRAKDAVEGWRAFAQHRPTHVFAALHCGVANHGAEQFLRKLNSDYMGAIPKVFVCCSVEELSTSPPCDPSAYVIWPIARSTLPSLVDTQPGLGDTTGRQVARLRELYEMSLLGPDLVHELDFVVTRAALGFQVNDCIIWGPSEEPHWPRSIRPIPAPQWPLLREQCEQAMHAGTTLFVSSGPPNKAVSEGAGMSLLAAALGPVGETPLAAICMVSHESKHFSGEARDSILILARRLSTELAWMSAHNRLVLEHEKLRQTALIDPMLGVWTRQALEQAISNAIASERKHQTALAIVIFDYIELRVVNDRYGHVTGDAVLAQFAAVVANNLRPQDQVGRFGGDELAVLLIGANLEAAAEIANGIVSLLQSTTYEDAEAPIALAVRAGVTVIQDDEMTGAEAFSRAGSALEIAEEQDSRVGILESSPDSLEPKTSLSQAGLLSAGSTLGGMYRILHEISRGSMGVVYRAEDLGLGRPVAIKLLRADLSSDEDLVAKFRSEAALLASLRHRNLVQVHSFGAEMDAVYFVMELVEGEPLAQIVLRLASEGHYIALDSLAKIIDEIAEALDAIHSLGIIHRDVKPDNVLVDRINDRAVLVDVGIAKRQGDARDAAGTPGFAAPESFMEADETPATDVYGLAATAYAILTGSAPYEGDSLDAVVYCQLNDPIIAPSQIRPDLPTAVDSVLATALNPDPSRRYRSANAFAIALNRSLLQRTRRPAPVAVAPASPPPSGIRSNSEFALSTYRLASGVDTQKEQELQHTRGAVFRSMGESLRRYLGTDWIARLEAQHPEIGAALQPSTPLQSWQPSEHFFRLLSYVNQDISESHILLRDLGVDIASSTLASLYGANPGSQRPGPLLKAAESYWLRYHNWGKLRTRAINATMTVLVLQDAPSDPLFCRLLTGMFGQIPVLAGASHGRCHDQNCTARGDSECSFTVRWVPSLDDTGQFALRPPS